MFLAFASSPCWNQQLSLIVDSKLYIQGMDLPIAIIGPPWFHIPTFLRAASYSSPVGPTRLLAFLPWSPLIVSSPSPVAIVLLTNFYEALLLSLHGFPILIFLDRAQHTRWCWFSIVRVQVSAFALYLDQHFNSSSILICLHYLTTKLYRNTNMNKKLCRVKTVIYLSCRNEPIFLKSQFLSSLLSSFIWKEATEEFILQFVVFYYLYLLPR